MLLALRSPRFGGTLLYAVSLLALGLLPPGDLAASPPTAGLVGYWPFDGSFDDESGNGNHASNHGAVLVGSDRPLTVSSRTFNDASTGTYGQSIPGVATTAAWGGDANLPRLVQLAHSPDDDSGFRTNVGAVNLRGTPLVLDLELHTGSGEPLGALQLEVPPYGHVQRSNVFGAVTTERLDDAFARVVAATAGGRYLVYASVVDNRSGDPVFVPGR